MDNYLILNRLISNHGKSSKRENNKELGIIIKNKPQ